GAVGTYRGRVAHPNTIFLLAARSGQRALPLYRTAGARRRVYPRRHGRDHTGQAGGAARRRGGAGRPLADRRDVVAFRRRALPAARPQSAAQEGAEIGRTAAAAPGAGAAAAGIDDFEDLHWIDPTSRELLDLTVEKITALPVLLVATYRPGFQPPWVGGSQVTVIALNRLGRNEGATLVHRLAGNLGALPRYMVEEIVERTDGVPLFVEELPKTVVEAGAVRGYASISAVPLSSLPVPA